MIGLPMARSAVLAGRTFGDLTRNVLVALVITGVGYAVGFRVETDEKQTCRHGETLFSAVDAKGSTTIGNSNLGHSLEGTPGPGKPGVIGRMLTEEER